MSDQPTYEIEANYLNETAQSSHLPVIVLALTIALWYAWGLGLVLIGVL